MPKTGSTSLQKALYANRDALRSAGYFYPDLGCEQHVALAALLARRARSKIPFPKLGHVPNVTCFADLLASEAPDCHSALISSEYLFQRPGCQPGHKNYSRNEAIDAIRRTAEYACQFFTGFHVEIVMWLRRQDNWLMSMYNQTIKGSLYDGTLSAFLSTILGTELYPIVSIWVQTFGRENVHCLAYDRLNKKGEDILTSFSRLLNVDLPVLKASGCVSNSDNASLSRSALEIKLLVNATLASVSRKSPVQAWLSQAVRNFDEALTRNNQRWRHALLSPDERLRLMDGFVAENSRLVSEYHYSELESLCDITDLLELKASGEWKPWPGLDSLCVSEFFLISTALQMEKLSELEALVYSQQGKKRLVQPLS
jgi:hypothetical protein